MLKRSTLTLLRGVGVFAGLRALRRSDSVVLTYHGVLPGTDDRPDFLSGNFVAEAAFDRQMRWITRDYEPVSLRDIVDAIYGGRPLPERAITVTFDDGFANNVRFAFPVLKKYRIPATVFLTTGHVGVRGTQLWTERVKRAIYLTRLARLPEDMAWLSVADVGTPGQREHAVRSVLGRLKRVSPTERDGAVQAIEQLCGRPPLTEADSDRYDFMTWDEVRTMAAYGVEFGSHTVSHPILTTLSEYELAAELSQSKATIEAELGSECYAFAYPNGAEADFGAREKRVLRDVGYRAAFTQAGRPNPVTVDPFEVARVNISRGYYRALFDARVTGALYFPEQWRRAVSRTPTRPPVGSFGAGGPSHP